MFSSGSALLINSKLFADFSTFRKFTPKSEHFEISLQNRNFHANFAQKSISFERGELKYRVSERGKNAPGPEFHSAFNAAITRF